MWLHNIADGLIWLSYMAIPVVLIYFVRRRRDMPFPRVFWMFGGFIVFCGFTHLFEIVMSVHPMYRLSGAIKLATAGISILTTVALFPIIPMVLALRSPEELERVNRRLKEEVDVRTRAEEELVRKNAALKESERVKDEFFANVSHELRTPLTLILGPVGRILSSPGLSESDREDLRMVERNARVLLKHVNDLLDVSRVDTGKLAPEYVDLDLARLVRETAANFDGLARERGLLFRVDAPASLAVRADSDQLERVIMNLLSNAFKFTPSGGKVRCALNTEADLAILTVADSGPGVPEAHRADVFRRFFQVQGDATRRFGGTGLGLAIVKEFVDLHRGSVAVGEAPEGGALFTVRLPVASPDGRVASPPAARPAAPSREMLTGELQAIAPPPLVPSEAPAGKDGPLVLVVEDNVDMSRHLCRLLSAGYRTARAADGREGVDLALRLHPDLILSDGMMPRMSGEEMLLDLRSRPEMSGTPIVMLTARAGDDARVRLLREGAQDYILKPFSPEELLARVRNLLAQSQARQELERRNEELQRAREDLQRTNQELEAFCYSVSHDLRAPLRSINGFSELMLEEQAAKLDDDGRRLLNAVRANATRMGELIDDLLEFSRTGRAAMRKTRLDLARLATEALRSLDAETSGRKIQVEVDALPPASGDETLIRQVFLNLLGNAVKYTRPRDVGWIEVQGKEGEKENTYWVRDNGVGFDPEYAHKLFGVFQRLHTSSQFEGTGVGLAIVQRVIQRHGGRVWAEGSVNGGATFYFTLPRG